MTLTTDQLRNSIQRGDCIEVMRRLPSRSADFILTDPPYLVRYKSRDGRSIVNDDNADWLEPAAKEMFRVLKNDSLCVSFYGGPRPTASSARGARRDSASPAISFSANAMPRRPAS